MKDCHVHIGQYFDEYYDFHNIFQILKNNGVTEAAVAYLTPKFDDEKTAIDFYNAVVEELKEAQLFAQSIELKADFLYWADPLVLQSISLEDVFSEFDYRGIAIHPILHAWTKDYPNLLTQIFKFAQKNRLSIFIHTGVSEVDQPIQFEKWFCDFQNVEVHLAHCKNSKPIIQLFSKYKNMFGDTAFCPKDSYDEICKAGFEGRMLFGSDFPVTHYFSTHLFGKKTSLAEQYLEDCKIASSLYEGETSK